MKRYSRFLILYLVCALFLSTLQPAVATEEETTPYPVITTSDSIEGWPDGPEIFSGSAVVIEAETGAVLYEKNMNQKAYPASITKIMTAILAIENCAMNEMVEFSDEAVFSVPRDSSHIAITPGEFLSVEDCLYGLLLASANEVANALGEHISGSMEAFVELMNARARELGAVGTHFNNTNGLPDENHYTTCYDMAMISRAAVFSDAFVQINATTAYMIPATNLQPEQRPVNTSHPLLINGSKHYEGCFGGKTGYTSVAGNTLVTFAKRNGMTLICVVMQSDSTHIYDDTTTLLNYGFENFAKFNIAENETKFNLQGNGLFESSGSIFEGSYPQLGLDKEGFVVLPTGSGFSEAESEVVFRSSKDGEEEAAADSHIMADINYTWHGHYVGKTTLNIESVTQNAFSFSTVTAVQETEEEGTERSTGEQPEKAETGRKDYLKINIWYVLGGVALVSIGTGIWYLMNITRQQRWRMKRIRRQKRQGYAEERRHRSRRRRLRSGRRRY